MCDGETSGGFSIDTIPETDVNNEGVIYWEKSSGRTEMLEQENSELKEMVHALEEALKAKEMTMVRRKQLLQKTLDCASALSVTTISNERQKAYDSHKATPFRPGDGAMKLSLWNKNQRLQKTETDWLNQLATLEHRKNLEIDELSAKVKDREESIGNMELLAILQEEKTENMRIENEKLFNRNKKLERELELVRGELKEAHTLIEKKIDKQQESNVSSHLQKTTKCDTMEQRIHPKYGEERESDGVAFTQGHNLRFNDYVFSDRYFSKGNRGIPNFLDNHRRSDAPHL